MNEEGTSDRVQVSVSLNLTVSTNGNIALAEAEDCIVQVSGNIVGTDLESGDGKAREVILGTVSFYLIRVGTAINKRFRLFDVFDTTQETMDAGRAVYRPSFQDYNAAVLKLFPDANSWDDLLLLHRLEIFPLARGQNLGLSVLARVIEDWSSGCSLVLMKPYPLQFEVGARESELWEELALGKFPQQDKPAFQRLRAYYEKLGFKRIGRSEFHALCVRERWTELEELDLPESYYVPSKAFGVTSAAAT